jgi:hypothetical protein
MSETNPKSNAQPEQIVALLCVSDVAGADGDAPLAMTPLYGQPFLHHLIKSLEDLGIRRFFIGIDAMPGALLTYGDVAKQMGLDVSFIRNPSDLAEQIGDDVRVLVQSADIIWEQTLVGNAIAQQKPLVAIVEEQPENKGFERIDLNNRWGGLAILERRSLAMLTSLPEGWDMGSALLRQALQDRVNLWPIAQKSVQAGLVRKLVRPEDLPATMAIFASPGDNGPVSLEKTIFSPLVTRLLPHIWSTSWSRSAAEWLFPGFAGLSAAMAGLSVPIVAGLLTIITIFSGKIRQTVRKLEYRSAQADWVGRAGWALLALGLGAALYHAELSHPEAGYVSLTMVAIAIFAKNYWKSNDFWLSSPLVIAIAALVGHTAGLTGWAVRLLIMAELASLLLSQLRSGRQNQPPNEQA